MNRERPTPPVDSIVSVQRELDVALEGVDATQFEAALETFAAGGGRCFFSGQGRSGLVAQMAAMRFMHLGFDAHVIGEATAPSVRAGDQLVLVSGSGRTPVSRSFARIAQLEGAQVILITTDARSPLGEIADVMLALPATSTSRQFGGSLFEQTALLVLDSLAWDLSGGQPEAYAAMQFRHTNLQ